MKIKNIAYLALFGSLVSVSLSVADAEISISAGETIQFNENFDNNYAGWSDVVITNGEGAALTKKAKIEGGVWVPSVDSDGGSTRSIVDINELDLSAGPISIYMKVKVEDVLDNPANARFGFELKDITGGRDSRFTFQIEPGNGVAKQFSYLQYRVPTGGSVTDNLGKTYANGIMTDPNAFYTFKLTITPVADGLASLQAYYYDSFTSSYLPFPGDTNGASSESATTGKGLDAGIFSALLINSRNGSVISSGSNAAHFDQVVITQASR
ncbi:hypothetical protein QEH52_02270 [Coraliomargarita sp. SDUM461003]|uniref:PEP-CTERM sorting domain-containing protein n=1 Tax=Thalassobacterium maritimum TaxID=3041265 RepID=A0ABU1AQD6_9BACT|nr:hypothetical protein [Coraliomargarita sp. SDUM461003]MDQ8206316.1 hypothetical protein [Coraliomargarita sp. SDUM461003]